MSLRLGALSPFACRINCSDDSPSRFNSVDLKHLRRAAQLSGSSAGFTAPHPNFGCVIAAGEKVFGEGYLYGQGSKPAEVWAVEAAGERSRGAVAYLNMEPGDCHGDHSAVSTIIQAGVSRVVVGIKHPLNHTQGNCIRTFRSEGLLVDVLDDSPRCKMIEDTLKACLLINAPLICKAVYRVPFSSLKFAMTLDGKIAASSGHASWISSKMSRSKVFQLRGMSDALVVGGNTVRKDNPLLTAREGVEHSPVRVVMSQTLDLPEGAKLWDESSVPTIVLTQRGARKSFQKFLASKGVEVIEFDFLNPRKVADYFHGLGYLSILWECGGTLAASAISSGVIHKVFAFIAPKIIGGKNAPTPVGELGMIEMSQAVDLFDVCYDQIGPDMLVSGFLQPISERSAALAAGGTYSYTQGCLNCEKSSILLNKTWELYGALSNYSSHPIDMLDGNGDYRTWPTVEHYYQAEKFVQTNGLVEQDCVEVVRCARSPEEAVRVAKTMQFDKRYLVRSDWEMVKAEKMYNALKCKFSTYPHLKSLLCSTAKSVIHDMSKGGFHDEKNLLGNLLMQLRTEFLHK